MNLRIHFIAGARTGRGIRIGSSRSEVVGAYGGVLQERRGTGSLMVLGRRRHTSRDALVFVFGSGRVSQIVLGLRGEITESRKTSDGRLVRCPR